MRTTILNLLLAVVASAILRWIAPASGVTSFRATLTLLPLIAWSFAWVRHRLPATAMTGPLRATQLLLLAVAALLAITRSHLGLAHVDAALAVGLLIPLAIEIVDQVRRLSRAARVDARLSIAPFILLPLITYLAILPWQADHRPPDGDEPYFLLLTDSLTHDFDADLSNQYAERVSLTFMKRAMEREWADPPPGPDGEQHSRQSIFLPLFLIPGWWIAGKWGALVTMAGIAAVGAGLAWRLSGAYFPRSPVGSVWVWALLAFTAPWLVYSYQVWVEIPGAVLMTAGLMLLRRDDAQESPPRWRWWALAGIAVGLLLLKHRFAIVGLSLVGLGWWRWNRSWRTALLVAGGAGAAIAAYLGWNWYAFGRPLRDHSLAILERLEFGGVLPYVQGTLGLFFDSAFGLFAASPAWLLLLVAAPGWMKRRHPLRFDLAVIALPYLLLVTPRPEWYGAWAPPFRFGVAMLPLLAVALVPLLNEDRSRRSLVTTLLTVATGALTALWVVRPTWVYHLADGSNAVLDRLSAVLGADAIRLFPSYVRPSLASWIWPAAMILTLPLLLFWTRRRQASPGSISAVLLLLAAATVGSAAHLPTRVIQFEDGWVRKNGGHLEPEEWTVARNRFAGGWSLTPGESVTVPFIARDSDATIEVRYRSRWRTSPIRLAVIDDRTILSEVALPNAPNWSTVSLPISSIHGHRTLRFQIVGPSDSRASVTLDQARVHWERHTGRQAATLPAANWDERLN